MHTRHSSTRENTSRAAARRPAAESVRNGVGHTDANNSPHVRQLKAYQQMADLAVQRREMVQRKGKLEEEELLQGKFDPVQRKGKLEEEELLQGKFETVQRVASGALPYDLQSGIERISGVPMDDVKVHTNSSEPATLQAHAFTKGSNIHIAPGQEKHLAHEAWHVVQQKQGRVQPTMRLNGQNINDSPSLEREADVMGAKALRSAPAQFRKKTS